MRMQDYTPEIGPFRAKSVIPVDAKDLRIMELERRVAELEAAMPAPSPVPGGPWPFPAPSPVVAPEWEIYCMALDNAVDFS